MKKTIYCCDKIQKPLIDIEPYNYLKPIQFLAKHNNNLEKNIYQNILDQSDLKEFEEFYKRKIELYNSPTNDMIIQEYIKCIPNINIIVIYPKATEKKDKLKELYQILQENGRIYYKKTLQCSFKYVYNLVYSLYAHTPRMKENHHILYKINRLGFDINIPDQEIIFLVYDHLNKDQPINGSSAIFKSKIRKIFLDEDLKTTKISPELNEYPREYDYIHVNDTFNESIEYGPLFLNKNTIKFLNKQYSWHLMNFNNGINRFNTFKEIIWNLSQTEQNKIIVMSSGVLFTYGVRDMNDIDGIAMDSIKLSTEEIDSLRKKHDFIDVSIKNTEGWNDKWENELNNRAKILGANDYNNLILDPKFYYYFLGIKFLRLKYELIIRQSRGRPAQTTDLLIIHRMFNMSYTIDIPKETKMYDEELKKDIITPVNKEKYLSTMKYYLKERYYINISIENIEDWIKSTNKTKMKRNIRKNLKRKKSKKLSKYLGGSNIDYKQLYQLGKNIANQKQIYPEQNDLIKNNFIPNIKILADHKPYLYEGEDWDLKKTRFCMKKPPIIHDKKDRLRIFTFNVHNFITRCNQGISPIYGESINPYQKGRNFEEFVKVFKETNADIICLQEFVPLFDKEIKKDIYDYDKIKELNFDYINKEMEKIGYKYVCIGDNLKENMSENNMEYYMLCNAIYSKFPIKNEKIFDLFLNRNMICIEIEFNNKNIWIINTHLEYFIERNKKLIDLNISKNNITTQFDTINYILDNEFNHNNIILCGDLNLNIFNKGSTKRYINFDENTKNITQKYINSSNSFFPTNFSQGETTDFILYNKNSNIRSLYNVVYTTYVSDHYGVIADFI